MLKDKSCIYVVPTNYVSLNFGGGGRLQARIPPPVCASVIIIYLK